MNTADIVENKSIKHIFEKADIGKGSGTRAVYAIKILYVNKYTKMEQYKSLQINKISKTHYYKESNLLFIINYLKLYK